jgi:hypothetical protein
MDRDGPGCRKLIPLPGGRRTKHPAPAAAMTRSKQTIPSKHPPAGARRGSLRGGGTGRASQRARLQAIPCGGLRPILPCIVGTDRSPVKPELKFFRKTFPCGCHSGRGMIKSKKNLSSGNAGMRGTGSRTRNQNEQKTDYFVKCGWLTMGQRCFTIIIQIKLGGDHVDCGS